MSITVLRCLFILGALGLCLLCAMFPLVLAALAQRAEAMEAKKLKISLKARDPDQRPRHVSTLPPNCNR